MKAFVLISLLVTACASAPHELVAVNKKVNAVPWVSDKGTDLWKSPKQFYANGGDCEDFASTKYWELINLGYDRSRLMIVSMKLRKNENHAVLWYLAPNGKNWVLDNREEYPMPLDYYTNEVQRIYDFAEIERNTR